MVTLSNCSASTRSCLIKCSATGLTYKTVEGACVLSDMAFTVGREPYLGRISYKSNSVFFFSSCSWRVRSLTSDSKLLACL